MMLDPNEEMGTFIAHCMYQELEKIAKFRIPGSFGLSEVDDLIRNASKLERPGLFLESLEGRARRKTLNQAQRQLKDIRSRALRQSQSADPKLREEALEALNQTQVMNQRLKGLRGRAKGAKPSDQLIEREMSAAPAAAVPPAPPRPNALVRARNLAGNATLGLGGAGAAYYGYTKMKQPSDPYSQY